LLGSAFEALIGALYLDSGLGKVEAFVSPMLEESRKSILEEIRDSKSQLQEWAQSQKLGTPRYKTIDSYGPDHARIFVVEVEINAHPEGRGTGPSKAAAEHAAALDALNNLAVI
jgi:ribonuclease-3